MLDMLCADSQQAMRLVLTHLSQVVLQLYAYDKRCIAFPEVAYSLFHARLYAFLQSVPIAS